MSQVIGIFLLEALTGSNYKFAHIREILGTFVLNANVYVSYDNISSLPDEKLNH